MTVRDLLNRLRWDPGAAQAGVTIVLRVREEGRATTQELPFDDVREILPAGVLSRDGTFLPYHRMIVVRRGPEVLWRAPERSEHGQA
ncbi:MAG: RNA repair domain-containing protein [Thermoanaerobaculaceae bacterium]